MNARCTSVWAGIQASTSRWKRGCGLRITACALARLAPVSVGFSEDCFVNGEDALFPLEDGCVLPLAHSLFDNDAIVLRDMAREVTLEAPGSARSVTVAFPNMPYLGI